MKRISNRMWALIAMSLALTACGSDDKPAAAVGAASTVQGDPNGPEVQIQKINEIDATGERQRVGVHKNNVVRISAESFVGEEAQNSAPADFTWQAGDMPACNAADFASCENSNFLVEEEGIAFVVPEDFGEEITLKVWLTSNPAKVDTVTLFHLGDDLDREDTRFKRFPRWNPQWNGERKGRWERHWDRKWDRNDPRCRGEHCGRNDGNDRPGRGEGPGRGNGPRR